ncbi:MAG TPA: hypothetical protein EYP23_07035 [Thermoplasmata archaeon]|nr:hypothetical protein [Thermoplasmata archaeon]
MTKRKLILLLTCILVPLLLCGCEEKTAGGQNNLSDKIFFTPSDIFNLVNGTLSFTTNKSGSIVKAEVTMRFQNIADRRVSVNVSVVFYDENNTELYVGCREFYDYPPGYTDQSILPANVVTYDGENASRVDHVVISVREIES